MSAFGRVLGAAAVGLLLAQPASAQGLFDALSRAVGETTPAQSPSPSPVKQFDAGQPTAVRPAKAGPAGLVEAVSGVAGLDVMDYVNAGQSFELGPKGSLTIAYFESCVVDSAKGGRLTVGAERSEVVGGQLSSKKVSCQAAKPIIVADASEAGAGAKRVTPFQGVDWYEQVSKSRLPTFKWPGGGAMAQVTVSYLDARPQRFVWQDKSAKGSLAYPKTAPALDVGMPYRVEVRLPTHVFTAVFSIDPGLDVADNALSRLVRVETP